MIITGSFPSLLSGVSQQVPRERIQGQLSQQLNMLSDPVTSLRRRPGMMYRNHIAGFNAHPEKTISQYMEVEDKSFNLYINTATGKIYVMDVNHNLITEKQHDYLIAPNATDIQITSANDYGWILNKTKKPALGAIDSTKLNPDKHGFFFIKTGAFQKEYSIILSCKDQNVSLTYTYKTDDSAANSVPEGVCSNLVNKMTADATFNNNFTIERVGAYAYIKMKAGAPNFTQYLTVTTSSGSNYVGVSNKMQVALSSDLPAKVVDNFNGLVCATGNSKRSREYYRWVAKEGYWEETGSYDSPAAITGMPIRFSLDGQGALTIEAINFEGRISGDDNNNPVPDFLSEQKGLTGIGSYQGRLVLMAGAFVNMSASNEPLRFLRSTVTTIRDDDPIQTAAGSVSAAEFVYAEPFNKDLILISSTHQAVIPAMQQGITPTNAMVVLGTKQSIDTKARPAVIGRTLMFSTPLSEDFFGIMELVPSTYTQSQYTPQTLTDHIPRMMPGRCRNIVGSNGANIALFLSDGDYRSAIVHEYLWSGEERPLVSWHQWSTMHEICSIHFARDIIVITIRINGNLVICTVDPKASAYLGTGEIRPFLDCFTYVDVVNNEFTIPDWMGTNYDGLRLANAEGELAGEPIGIENINAITKKGRTVRSFPNGKASIGWKYTSAMSPTPPQMRDQNDVVIGSNKTTILRYDATVQKSGEFFVDVVPHAGDQYSADVSAMTWSSKELMLNHAVIATLGDVTIPVRAISASTDVVLRTDGTRELNILDIEFTLKTAVKAERKRI